ncbi:MAG: DUF559 domain-containing protein [Acidobacteriota bacterium]|nr:DUF559 domain-containing protein [Acidobacteriota bacterium]
MSELWTRTAQDERRIAKVRVGKLAAKQFGHVTWAQLRHLGVADGTIRRWTAIGYLIAVHPRVYAVGHFAADRPARLFSLVLHAGPDAGLSHGTCAHWRGWLRYPVKATHVSTPRRMAAPVAGVTLHCRRSIERELVNGIPCTTITQTLLDLAATEPPKLVYRSLAQLDYERRLRPAMIRKACGRGRPGSVALLEALGSYIPEMALTKSELEDEFLMLCRRFGIPIPTVNTSLDADEPDCYWPDAGLVVELDGDGNHGTPAQRRRDRRKEMKLRARGLTVIRYDPDQVMHDASSVANEVLALIAELSRRIA